MSSLSVSNFLLIISASERDNEIDSSFLILTLKLYFFKGYIGANLHNIDFSSKHSRREYKVAEQTEYHADDNQQGYYEKVLAQLFVNAEEHEQTHARV